MAREPISTLVVAYVCGVCGNKSPLVISSRSVELRGQSCYSQTLRHVVDAHSKGANEVFTEHQYVNAMLEIAAGASTKTYGHPACSATFESLWAVLTHVCEERPKVVLLQQFEDVFGAGENCRSIEWSTD